MPSGLVALGGEYMLGLAWGEFAFLRSDYNLENIPTLCYGKLGWVILSHLVTSVMTNEERIRKASVSWFRYKVSWE